jgi:hypothetical protein
MSITETSTKSKPEPAVGQGWEWNGDGKPTTIERIDEHQAHFVDGTRANLWALRDEPRWRCAGVKS